MRRLILLLSLVLVSVPLAADIRSREQYEAARATLSQLPPAEQVPIVFELIDYNHLQRDFATGWEHVSLAESLLKQVGPD
ncbi:MAG TPA: hypothetical protein VJ960_05130, partial [Oceanipulchritudo sp.]|nr:hypothetical protein [Oceanipulchritudo sp.]